MNMRALVVERAGKAVVRTMPVPPVGKRELRIKVSAAGICGTDVHIFKGEYLGTYPVIPGHEFTGVVEEAGEETGRIHPGDFVAVEPNISCGNCEACLNNRQNFCEHWEAVGVTLPGGFAEYAVVPENVAFNVGKLSPLTALFVEPLSCALHGVERARIKLGDQVLILGAGPIGILLSQAIQLQGAVITQVDRNEARLKTARQYGAKVFSSLEGLAKDAYDVVVDASGAKFLMEKSIDLVRKGGTVLLFGVPRRDERLDLPAFTIFEKGLTLLSSYTSVRNSIQAVRLLESGKIDPLSLVSHQLPLEEFERGIALIEKGEDNVMKVAMLP
jgi:2-desacetyl-2-hydroxyethyl bacteriochlorophyllide A dehydrogenase